MVQWKALQKPTLSRGSISKDYSPENNIPIVSQVNGVPVKPVGVQTIRTIPTSNEPLRLASGSCTHRLGLGHPTLWNNIEKRNPLAILLIGDIAADDRGAHMGFYRLDLLMRGLFTPWRQFATGMPVFTGWDDHDNYGNDRWGIPPKATAADRRAIRKIYSDNWMNPTVEFGDEKAGTFQRTRIGPCDVIMTNNRYFRKNEKGYGNFLGKEQLEWVKQQLLDCKGPFIILSCGTMWSDYVSNGKDSWGRFDPEGREEIFQFIEDNHIPGVLLISSDRHGARGFTLTRKRGYRFYEFGGASLGSRQGAPATDPTKKGVRKKG